MYKKVHLLQKMKDAIFLIEKTGVTSHKTLLFLRVNPALSFSWKLKMPPRQAKNFFVLAYPMSMFLSLNFYSVQMVNSRKQCHQSNQLLSIFAVFLSTYNQILPNFLIFFWDCQFLVSLIVAFL